MKRFLLRAPLRFHPLYTTSCNRSLNSNTNERMKNEQNGNSGNNGNHGNPGNNGNPVPKIRNSITANHVTIMEPVAVNIDVNTEILQSLTLSSALRNRRTNYELLTAETRSVKVPGCPIVSLSDWRRTCEGVLESARCYPESVMSTLMTECRNLVYSRPSHRRGLLDFVKNSLMECGYPISSELYNTYLVVIADMRQDVDLNQVFEDLNKLGLVLSYDSHKSIILADSVCSLLALQGEMDQIHKCWQSFTRSRKFRGFSNKSFGIIASGHIIRGEFDELTKLQSTLSRGNALRGFESFYQYLALTFARTGQLELLDTLLRKHWDASVLTKPHIFWKLIAELLDKGHEDFVNQILSLFQGLQFGTGRYLEKVVCDMVSRGGVRLAADLIVHGSDVFKFDNARQQRVFEMETLPDIIRNMPDNLNNILIQVELRGIETGFEFDFDKIDDSVVNDMDKLEGEFPESEWLKQLYDNKMSKTVS